MVRKQNPPIVGLLRFKTWNEWFGLDMHDLSAVLG